MRRSYPDPLRLAPTSPLKRIAQSHSQAVSTSPSVNEMYIMGEGDDDWVDAELKGKKSSTVPRILRPARGGRGHDPAGALGTKSGELALRCPACPRPNVNLPDNWENEPSASSCKYTMNLAFDACFRLKRRDISNEIRDPGLGTGLSYFVEPTPYHKYIETIKDQKEMSSCSKLAAIDHANTKFARGYAVTGVVMGVCTRHEFVQPNGVADLQRGERFGNVDWVFLSILRHLELQLRFLISYDIACQWCKRLFERVDALPFQLSLVLVSTLFRFVVPKLHILGHIAKCQAEFSLNYTPGSGQADGESIERAWSNIGACGANTRVCGPGARADQLDDHFGFWNWGKMITLGDTLRRRLDKALLERERQHDSFLEFSIHQEERLAAWKAMVVAYEADDKSDNPYEPRIEGMSESQVRAQLEEAEEEDEKNGRWQPISEISPATFMAELLDLEHEQARRTGTSPPTNPWTMFSRREPPWPEWVWPPAVQFNAAKASGRHAGSGPMRKEMERTWALRKARWSFPFVGFTVADSCIGLRIEWTKAWGRDRRWSEEVVILTEETRRVPLSFDHLANTWLCRAEMVTGREELTNDEREGLVAYAVSQSDTFHNLARRAEDSATQPRMPKGARTTEIHEVMEDDAVGEQIEQQIDELELGNASDEDEEEEG
ncbi:hypothetical protein HMN09_01426400 [Mycena chlorophos]|uniref:CxC2-like cysteine cluster KDZ transposase-associated domain-containing protein n=1 Tax=Mycena chlorophos TaxID=658473 RepID=A0A8H6VQB5_MYCCL|nr:hypothetical protein HMN09_01426400 [Mycena chlorophos]